MHDVWNGALRQLEPGQIETWTEPWHEDPNFALKYTTPTPNRADRMIVLRNGRPIAVYRYVIEERHEGFRLIGRRGRPGRPLTADEAVRRLIGTKAIKSALISIDIAMREPTSLTPEQIDAANSKWHF